MKNLLSAAGTEGITLRDLNQKCRTHIFKIPDIAEIISDWKERGLVQKFEVKQAHSKRPVTIIRATTLILKERL